MTDRTPNPALGKMWRDSLTGIEGNCVAVYEYLYACRHFRLEWVKDGELKSETFEEPRLEAVKGKIEAVPDQRTGGPGSRPPGHRSPR
jgi:hypothetical protein